MLPMTMDHTMNYQIPTFLFLLKLIPPSAIWIETTSWKESSSENGSDATSAFLSSELVFNGLGEIGFVGMGSLIGILFFLF